MYWDRAFEAVNAKDEYVIKLALNILVGRYVKDDPQKVDKYLSIAKENFTGKA